MPRRKLTEVEQFFITGNQSLGAKELAKRIGGVCVKAVQNFIDTLPAEPEPPPPAPPKAGDHIIKQSAEKKSRGVTVMTEAASSLSERSRKKVRKEQPDRIFKIRNNDRVY